MFYTTSVGAGFVVQYVLNSVERLAQSPGSLKTLMHF